MLKIQNEIKMNKSIIIIVGGLLLSIISCEGKTQRQKGEMVENSISEMKTEIDSLQKTQKKAIEKIENSETENITFIEQLKNNIYGKNPGDSIIGLWEVQNDYYMAIYEIIKFENQYFGKMHYYNDMETEIQGQNNEDDYFLDGIFYKDGKYTNGKMYMPDGKQYQAKFVLKGDRLHVQMMVEGQPYTEIWKRKNLN